jgi:hypothetical protein
MPSLHGYASSRASEVDRSRKAFALLLQVLRLDRIPRGELGLGEVDPHSRPVPVMNQTRLSVMGSPCVTCTRPPLAAVLSQKVA